MSSAITISKSKLVITPIQSTKSKFILAKNSRKNLIRSKEYNGYISKSTTKRINCMVESLIFAIEQNQEESMKIGKSTKIQPTFITLTLSYAQIQSDNYIKRNMLMRFIELCKNNKGVVNYIWRAEPQVNGNIHFHIIADKFIKWQWIREKWNEIQSKHEYLDAFEQKHGHRDPNSTDIHGLQRVNNIAAYICKYMTKDKPLRKIEGRIWGCSKNLHKMKNPRIEICEHIINEIEELVRDKKAFKKVYEWCTVIKYKKLHIQHTINDIIYNVYQEFVNEFINFKNIEYEP
ncbi:MAG: hypothetical protein QM504_14505 [Pseudomonadota bacterium]